jgi:xanthine phosphoribosyltransferase
LDLLEKKILEEGTVIGSEILKVDSFLNHQIDVSLANEMGKEIYAHFKNSNVNKILTVEASGIGLACIVAQYFNCKVVFAKKSKTRQLTDDLYCANVHSFTHGDDNIIRVSKKYIDSQDTVLILDDFLAMGEAVNGMMDIVKQAGAKLAGVAIAIEKGFQGGGDKLRAQGIDLYSLAIVDRMSENGIQFRK